MLIPDVIADKDMFFNYFRMPKSRFQDLLNRVSRLNQQIQQTESAMFPEFSKRHVQQYGKLNTDFLAPRTKEKFTEIGEYFWKILNFPFVLNQLTANT